MMLPRFYAVTDEKVLPNDQLLLKAEQVLEAGVRLLQVRFKETAYSEQLRLGSQLRSLTRRYGSFLIVNDSPELAQAIKADGVHLGVDDPKVPQAREILGNDAIVGVSCYEDIRLVRQSASSGASYIGLSSPYPSATKRKESISMSGFRELVTASRLPCYAIGGITPERVSRMMDAGCWGVAVISAIFGALDPSSQTRRFLAELERLA
jgi:thiamine-phosphate pyrophosphorylase